tara:strand:- start:1585 stop:2196 length:612 start_codon:yes stop_codon:yes gene_type:complete
MAEISKIKKRIKFFFNFKKNKNLISIFKRKKSIEEKYPNYIFKGNIESALIPFCAAFLGENDVKYFINVNNVTLIDLDKDKIEIMKNEKYNYKSDWNFIIGDCWIEMDKLIENNTFFDVVSVDCWTTQIEEMINLHFKNIYKIANKYVVLIYSKEFDEKYGLNKSKETIQAYIEKKYEFKVNLIDMIKRSNFKGGIYWLVFKK